MKKRLALTLAVMMGLSSSFCTAYAAEPNEPIKTEEDFQEVLDEIDYEPNEDYDKYTVVYHYLEDISADMFSMVSANEDETEFYIEVFWYGVDDQGLVKVDGDEFEVVEDKSGFLSGPAVDIVKLAIEQDFWKTIGEDAEEGTEKAAEEDTEEAAEKDTEKADKE